MGLTNILKSLFTPVTRENIIRIYLQDEKCGRKIKVILRKSYDIQKVYREDKEASFYLNKVVICDKCFNKIIVKLYFDQRYKITAQEINGGELISEEEFKRDSSDRP